MHRRVIDIPTLPRYNTRKFSKFFSEDSIMTNARAIAVQAVLQACCSDRLCCRAQKSRNPRQTYMAVLNPCVR